MKLMCPRCEVTTVDDTALRPKCSPCTYQWKDWVDYYASFGVRTAPAPEVSDYISSGEMQDAIETLVADAVEKAVDEERMKLLDRLVYDCEKRMNTRGIINGGVDTLDAMREMRDDAKRTWEAKYSGDH